MNSLTRIVLLACLLVAVISAPAAAYHLVTQRGQLPLMEQRIHVTIDNQMAITTLEQTFSNPNDSTEEGAYRFPLGEKASVQEFGLTGSDGVRRVGSIEEKHDAEAIYQNAQDMNAQPAIAQQSDPNSFETKIGSIPAHSRTKVDLTYTEILPYHMGKVQYSIPMNVKSIQQKSMDVVAVTIDLKDQKEIVEVKSPTHPISAKKVDAHHWQITFERSAYLPDADFQLNYEVKAQRMGFNFLSTQPDKNDKGYFMLMLAPQEVVDASDIVARDIVFVMDVSGSMGGYKIQQTKDAFNYFVDQLNSDDRFGIISFNDGITNWKPLLVSAAPQMRLEAKSFINQLESGGGTNIFDALGAARQMFSGGKSSKAIVFLTDGEPTAGQTDPGTIAKNMRQSNTQNIRTFVFGVGENVCTQLLDTLALENSGEAVYVHENEQLQAKLSSFYETISKPLLVDLGLDWGNIEVSDCYPSKLPNLYKGSQIMVLGRYKQGGATKVKVSGTLNGSLQEFPVEAAFAKETPENKVVARLWAKAKADSLIQEMRAYGESTDKKNEVIKLSKSFQFTTPFTSFVSVCPERVAPVKNAQLDPYRTSRAVTMPSQPAPVAAMNVVMPPSNVNVRPSQLSITRSTEAKKVSLWGAYSFLPIAPLLVPNFRKAREQAREKACYGNMRVILGAVEMYNMDHDQFLQAVDERHLTALTQLQYLRGTITKPDTGCAYYTEGDLTANGRVVCALHGGVDDGTYSYSSTPGVTQTAQSVPTVNVVDSTPWETKLWNQCFPLIELAINIPILLIGLWFSWVIFSAPFRWLFEAAAATQSKK